MITKLLNFDFQDMNYIIQFEQVNSIIYLKNGLKIVM